MLDLLDDVGDDGADADDVNELLLYVKTAERVSKDACPLTFWKANEVKYPILAKMAKRFLAIPASSGGIERRFSIAGSISRARRASTKAESIENVILIRENQKDSVLKHLRSFGIYKDEPVFKKSKN